jgi:hypothetical protein
MTDTKILYKLIESTFTIFWLHKNEKFYCRKKHFRLLAIILKMHNYLLTADTSCNLSSRPEFLHAKTYVSKGI